MKQSSVKNIPTPGAKRAVKSFAKEITNDFEKHLSKKVNVSKVT